MARNLSPFLIRSVTKMPSLQVTFSWFTVGVSWPHIVDNGYTGAPCSAHKNISITSGARSFFSCNSFVVSLKFTTLTAEVGYHLASIVSSSASVFGVEESAGAAAKITRSLCIL